MLPKTAEKKSTNEAPADAQTDPPAEVKAEPEIAPRPEDTTMETALSTPAEPTAVEEEAPAPCVDGEAMPKEGESSEQEGSSLAEEPAPPPEPEPEPEPVGSRRPILILFVNR